MLQWLQWLVKLVGPVLESGLGTGKRDLVPVTVFAKHLSLEPSVMYVVNVKRHSFLPPNIVRTTLVYVEKKSLQ